MFSWGKGKDKGEKRGRKSRASMPVDEQPHNTDVVQTPVKSVVKKKPRVVIRISTEVLCSRLAVDIASVDAHIPTDIAISKITQDIMCAHHPYYFFHAYGCENINNRLGIKGNSYVEIDTVGVFIGIINYAKREYVRACDLCADGCYLSALIILKRADKIINDDFLYDLEAAALSARIKMTAKVVLNLSKMVDDKASKIAWQYFLINDQVVQMFVNVLLGVQKLLLGDKFYGTFLSNGIAAHFDDNFRGLFFREIKVFDHLVLMLAIHMPRYLLPPTVIGLEGSLYGPSGMIPSKSRIDLYDKAKKIEGYDAGRCHQYSCEKVVFDAFGIKDWHGLSGVNWSKHNDSKQLLGKAVHVMYLVHSLFGYFLPLENYEIASVDASNVQCYVTTQLFVLREMLSPKCENYAKLLELQTLYKDGYSVFQPILSEFIAGIRAVTSQIKELSAEPQGDVETPNLGVS
ncbi:MAG: hypothetical protein KAS93_01275 [Gammaproteobacteria bacterium]|nr:hypothetical protein [Gammaproteobacteria bacterium]